MGVYGGDGMKYGITINLEYYSVIDECWYRLQDIDSRSSIFGNKAIYKRYYIRGYIRNAR